MMKLKTLGDGYVFLTDNNKPIICTHDWQIIQEYMQKILENREKEKEKRQ